MLALSRYPQRYADEGDDYPQAAIPRELVSLGPAAGKA